MAQLARNQQFFDLKQFLLLFYALSITIFLLMENQLVNTSVSSEAPILPFLQALNTKFDHSYEDSEDDIDEDRCYLMQIEQLKRENNFLKKKIAQLNKRHPALGGTVVKRRSLPPNIKPAVSISSLPDQNYVIAFFEEIIRLLESFSDLFRVQAESNLKEELSKQQAAFTELTAFNPESLNRALGRLLLEPEQKKYPTLLGIFEAFYKDSTDRMHYLKVKTEQLTTQAIEVGKRMAESVRQKERIKGSRIFGGFSEREDGRSVDELSIMKHSGIKSTCTESLMDLSACRFSLAKEKLFENIF